MELELVIVVPVLMMIVLFVVWAGRVGHAGLAAELAAEEAAVAAALSAEERREEVAAAIVESSAALDYLCVDGPAPVGDGYVSAVQRDFANTAGVARGIGLVGVTLRCETDGAVPVLRGLAPTVVHYGRGSEPFVVTGAADLPTLLTPDIAVPEGPTQQWFQTDLVARTALIELSLDRPAVGRNVNVVATTEEIAPAWCDERSSSADPPADPPLPEACGGERFGNGGCESSPDGAGAGFFDYSETSFSGVILEGEQRISFPITIIDDCIDENDERFRVNLAVQGANLQSESFTVIIEDNDPTPTVAFAFDADLATDADTAKTLHPCRFADRNAAGWRLSEDGAGTCAKAEIKLQLRYDTDPYDTAYDGGHVLGLSGRPVSLRVVSLGAPVGGTTAANAPIGECPADFTPVDIPIRFMPASGDYTGEPLSGAATVANEISGYNTFTDEWANVINDVIDERSEHFTLSLNSLSNVLEFDEPDPKGTDGSASAFWLFRTTRVEILDDEAPDPDPAKSSIPWLSAAPDPTHFTAGSPPRTYTGNRGTLRAEGLPVQFVVRDEAANPSVASQGVSDTQGLPIDYEIVINYSDDPATPAADDVGSLPLSLPDPKDNFIIPPCQHSRPSTEPPINVLAPFNSQVQPFIDAGVITRIDFILLSAPRSWSQPPHAMYRIDPGHTDFTITVTGP